MGEDITEGIGGMAVAIPIVVGIVALIVIAFAVAQRYRVTKPDEAIIVTGSGGKRGSDDGLPAAQKVVQGGGVFVMPFIQQAHSISLSSRQISTTINAISHNGIILRLQAVAIVKVGGRDEQIRAAAQRFLGQQEQINTFTEEVLAGSLRSIVGTMTVEQINSDRSAFASKVATESESSLGPQGLAIDTFQIQDISDDVDYLKNLGRPEEARVKQLASISEADAYRESERAKIAAEQDILDARRERDLREAEIKKETDAANAEAAASGPRSEARARQEVLDEEQKVAERQVRIRQQQLEAEVSREADAQRYREEQEAEARRYAQVAEAEAKAKRVELEAQADANRVRLNAEADANKVNLSATAEANRIKLAGEAEADNRRSIADAVEQEGRAEATATREKGLAEAEAMDKKAEAYRNYGDAAIVDTFIAALPKVVSAASEPMSNIKNMTVIDTEGASKLTSNVANNVSQGTSILGSLGFDVDGLLKSFMGDFGSSNDADDDSADTEDDENTVTGVTVE